jgi:S-adenosyl methyltransferase
MSADMPDWVPSGVDTKRANPARVYDYWLGGTHNFLADQDAGRAVIAADPNMRDMARANRAFLGRAVRFLATQGIRQYLDIGSGIPTQGNVHEIAQQAAPGSRVAYVDIDPVAVAHSRVILAGTDNAGIFEADLREPETILAHSVTRSLIDFDEPAGLLLSAVLHFIGDDEDPWRLTRRLRDALAPGSYLVISHGTERAAVAQAAGQVYNRTVSTQIHLRSPAEVRRFFDGFELVEPGVVFIPGWRPDSPADAESDPARIPGLVGVARKP